MALETEALSLYRSSARGTWGESSFTEDSGRYVKKAREMEHLSACRGSIRETCKGGFQEACNRRLLKRSISFYRGSIRGT
jgi:hypothetical protein